ncbi:MAG: nucleotidyltransferase domain-containing protein [Deltaproteobacteria bacterium]|nr:nucleotidyltransferase domain-containing protein [Deltaproteobacteria bacterium]
MDQLGVQAIYLFGSRVQEEAGPLSDYDYAVLLKEKGHARGDDLYFELYDLFCKISPRTLKNDVIDIIFLRDAGLELRFHVVRYGKALYDKNPKARLNFEDQTTLLYCDYRPLLDRFDRTITQSL